MTPRLRAAAVAVGLAVAVLAPLTRDAGAASDSGRVVEGSDRYLYIAQDWTVACQDRGRARHVAGNVAALAAALQAGGREVVVVVGPDKSTTVDEHVPARPPEQACAGASRAALWQELTARGGPSFLDLRPALREADRDVQTYWRKDTHWTPTAGTVYARQLARRLDPVLALRLQTRPATYSRHGDLARVLGRDDAETVQGLQLINPGVRVQELSRADIGMGQPARRTRAVVSPGGRVLAGRTVLVGDSFDDTALEQLAPLFEETLAFWPGLHDSSMPTIMAQLRTADRVVVETVERFGQRYRMFDDEAVRAARRLPRR
ncbi:MAG: hypothetical protein JWM64_2706 [Frankiales bacterium]|nr:hypothetical protein [Frankiales bacterium]